MENVVSWNKSVRGGESCQLEQKGKGWLSAGTKSEETVVPQTCHHISRNNLVFTSVTMGWWPGAREVILWILLQHGMMVTTDWKIMIEGSIRVVPDASGYHCRYIRIGNSLASYHISFCKPRSESDCFLVIQNAVSPSVCKPCSESDCFLVFQSAVCDSLSVSASLVQNQTVFSGLAERSQ